MYQKQLPRHYVYSISRRFGEVMVTEYFEDAGLVTQLNVAPGM